MAVVKQSGHRRFATVVPGGADVHPFEWPSDDESIWARVSGDWKEIGEIPHVLYRQGGTLYLRIGSREVQVDDRVATTLRREGHHLHLHIATPSVAFDVVECIPDWLIQSPITDHLVCDDVLWTYRVHHVLCESDGRAFYWSAER